MTNSNIKNVIFFCIAFAFILLAGNAPVFAQNSPVSMQAEMLEAKKTENAVPTVAAPGTYQFLAKDASSHEIFPYDILQEIERNRHKSKVVFMNAGKATVIKILPYKTIQSKKFVPLPEYGVQK